MQGLDPDDMGLLHGGFAVFYHLEAKVDVGLVCVQLHGR